MPVAMEGHMKHSALASALVFASTLPAAFHAAPAAAKVVQVDERGFVIRHLAEVPVSPAEAWSVLVKPSVWWDSRHTFSSDSANLSLDARPGGCFCEVLPDKDSSKAPPRGGVEHMRVVYIEKPRALRMVGALGPLQSDAVTGTLTIQLKPVGEGEDAKTQILLEYVVGGYLRTPTDKMAPTVDTVLGEQVAHLVESLGGAFDKAFSSPEMIGGLDAPEAEKGVLRTGVKPLAAEPLKPQDGEPVGR